MLVYALSTFIFYAAHCLYMRVVTGKVPFLCIMGTILTLMGVIIKVPELVYVANACMTLTMMELYLRTLP